MIGILAALLGIVNTILQIVLFLIRAADDK